LRRLVDGNTKVVKKGSRVCVLSVCREAGVDRATLYRFHEPVLVEIRRLTGAEPKARLEERRVELTRAQARLRGYRQLAEQAQRETEALARVNYGLQARVAELEESLRNRDAVIRGYQDAQNKTRGGLSDRSQQGSASGDGAHRR
jgi:hypothetical protein